MKTMIGTIVSLKSDQTATVLVERSWMHPVYKKYVKRTKKYACEVAGVKVAENDEVMIAECKPVSKTKHFRIVEKVEAGA